MISGYEIPFSISGDIDDEFHFYRSPACPELISPSRIPKGGLINCGGSFN